MGVVPARGQAKYLVEPDPSHASRYRILDLVNGGAPITSSYYNGWPLVAGQISGGNTDAIVDAVCRLQVGHVPGVQRGVLVRPRAGDVFALDIGGNVFNGVTARVVWGNLGTMTMRAPRDWYVGPLDPAVDNLVLRNVNGDRTAGFGNSGNVAMGGQFEISFRLDDCEIRNMTGVPNMKGALSDTNGVWQTWGLIELYNVRFTSPGGPVPLANIRWPWASWRIGKSAFCWSNEHPGPYVDGPQADPATGVGFLMFECQSFEGGPRNAVQIANRADPNNFNPPPPGGSSGSFQGGPFPGSGDVVIEDNQLANDCQGVGSTVTVVGHPGGDVIVRDNTFTDMHSGCLVTSSDRLKGVHFTDGSSVIALVGDPTAWPCPGTAWTTRDVYFSGNFYRLATNPVQNNAPVRVAGAEGFIIGANDIVHPGRPNYRVHEFKTDGYPQQDWYDTKRVHFTVPHAQASATQGNFGYGFTGNPNQTGSGGGSLSTAQLVQLETEGNSLWVQQSTGTHGPWPQAVPDVSTGFAGVSCFIPGTVSTRPAALGFAPSEVVVQPVVGTTVEPAALGLASSPAELGVPPVIPLPTALGFAAVAVNPRAVVVGVPGALGFAAPPADAPGSIALRPSRLGFGLPEVSAPIIILGEPAALGFASPLVDAPVVVTPPPGALGFAAPPAQVGSQAPLPAALGFASSPLLGVTELDPAALGFAAPSLGSPTTPGTAALGLAVPVALVPVVVTPDSVAFGLAPVPGAAPSTPRPAALGFAAVPADVVIGSVPVALGFAAPAPYVGALLEVDPAAFGLAAPGSVVPCVALPVPAALGLASTPAAAPSATTLSPAALGFAGGASAGISEELEAHIDGGLVTELWFPEDATPMPTLPIGSQVPFTVALQNQFGPDVTAPPTVSPSDGLDLLFEDPDGQTTTAAAVLVTEGTYPSLTAPSPPLAKVGRWRVQARVSPPSSPPFYSPHYGFDVED